MLCTWSSNVCLMCVEPVFGVPLEVACERRKCADGIELPTVVRECVDYIEEYGMFLVSYEIYVYFLHTPYCFWLTSMLVNSVGFGVCLLTIMKACLFIEHC
jgi:hypothetical protein